MKCVNAFSPSLEDKKLMQDIKENKTYKFRCWLPESSLAIGDTWVYFNDLEKDFEDYKWIRNNIERNPHWVQDVQTEIYINQK